MVIGTMPNGNEIVGRNLIRLRNQKNISQAELGRTSAVSQRTVSNIEKMGAAGSPTIDTVEVLAKYFKVPLWLMMVENMPLNQFSRKRLDEALQTLLNMSDQGFQKVLDRIEEIQALERIRGDNS